LNNDLLTDDINKTVCICKEKLKISTIIVGFPGIGLIGSIAAKYIVKELKMSVKGYIRSPLIPPLAVFLDGVLAYPYRIYVSTTHDLAVLIGESPAPVQAYYYLANAVLDWGNEVGAKEILCIDGFQDPFSNSKDVYLVAEPDLKSKIDKINLPKPQTGYIGGLSGAILNETILREIDGYALLCGTTDINFPDPDGSANIIEVLNKLKTLKIDTTSLRADGDRIKKTMQEFADKTRQVTDDSVYDSTDKSTLYT
jgi:uncharacterized protein